jgi:hypothetical protein
MARPQRRFGRGRDQVHSPLPSEERGHEAVQPVECFT